jgi:hypothetical protein
MNLLLLAVVPPLFCAWVCDAIDFRNTYCTMSVSHQVIVSGGFHQRGWGFWVGYGITLTLSSVGTICSFYLHAMGAASITPPLIFISYCLGYILSTWAILDRNTRVVFVLLLVNITTAAMLLLHTMLCFPSSTALHSLAHVGNAVMILHVTLYDFAVWQWGWWKALKAAESPPQISMLLY